MLSFPARLAAWGVGFLLLASAGFGRTQTLAHKNWAGSGMSAQTWWSRGVFCRVGLRPAGGTAVTLKTVAARLEALEGAGCDAVVLGALGTAGPSPVDAAYGSVEDADAVIEEIGRRKMRLVLEMPVAGAFSGAGEQDLTARMRFWLTRGVAGFAVRGDGAPAGSDVPGVVKRLRAVVSGSLGTRVLIADGVDGPDSQLVVRRVDAALQAGQTAAVRQQLAGADGGLAGRLPLLVAADTRAETAKVMAALLLLEGDAAMVAAEPFASKGAEVVAPVKREFSAEEMRLWIPASEYAAHEDQTAEARDKAMIEWYRALTEMHHANVSLRDGQATYLNQDSQDVLVWVVRAKGLSAPVLVACNLSGHATKVAVGDELKTVGVRKSYLRTLLRSQPEQPHPATVEDIDLEADGVFVGEIR
ncbi:hypothetical protein [Granulicella sibirica]|uniref:Uncharacterized protein n=1 Tax=Granulicella sibirica TaxID=2479048 RepID=A0A4Q0T873_9BACT|nr:hypothetical protein [Granulicella sibirica]RXH57811.1 hypothetical protein GRAN_1121 [Granulicella sibirica]